MRIVSGKYRSRRLETPKSYAVRPTTDKVRGALFNALNSCGVVVDSVVLDAFCGTGALGLEALSQGAQEAIFIDKSKVSLNLCKLNIENLGVGENAHVLFGDSARLKERSGHISKASLIFLDPPYNKGLIEPTIEALMKNNWIDNDAFFVIEVDKNEEPNLDDLDILSIKNYGTSKIIFAQDK